MATATKLCVSCKTRRRNEEMKQTPNKQWFCDAECVANYAYKRIVKSNAQSTKKKHAKERREVKESDTRHQHKLTQTSFNRLRVLQELKWFKDMGVEPYCISCGKTHMDWCCGHLKTRGAQGNLRYDEANTYLQCNRYCNMGLSGNISGDKNTHGYIKGLAIRFGEDRASEIINYCETNTQTKKWTGKELVGMRKAFNKEVRKLL